MISYFEYYDIPEQLQLDLGTLKRKYYDKSRTLHPDFHTGADIETQANMLEQSTLNNTAYKVLMDPVARLRHLLLLKGILDMEEKTVLPPDFLMEMMELNEEIEMAETDDRKKELIGEIGDLLRQNQERMEALFIRYDMAVEVDKYDVLKELGALYSKNKYFLRLKQSVSIFAAT